MYKVGVLVNENELAHSAFANTPALLHRIIHNQEHKEKQYRFVVFDKFNIADLFKEGDINNLMTFDSIFISTNATNNAEILEALLGSKDKIASFISAGKGIFISSQKKLSCKENNPIQTVSFLPSKYDYAIVDRPEKSSADGTISVVGSSNIIMTYPNYIEARDINYQCSHNTFMQHKYRSFLIPQNESQFIPLLSDKTSTTIPPALANSLDKSRNVLLCSAKETERVVISTMALDWAEHMQLIENILVYITEGVSNFAFILKKGENSESVINSYILRAEVGKISFRQYEDPDLNEMVTLPHTIYVFSPKYTNSDVENFLGLAKKSNKLLSVYHLVNTENKSFALYHFTSETSIDKIKGESINWITRHFYPNLWGKSVWTYNYSISMMTELEVNCVPFLSYIYEELSSHFCKKEVIDGSYDNVINATCNMLEIIHNISPYMKSMKDNIFDQYPVSELLAKVERWLVDVLSQPRCSEYDKLYVLISLYKCGYVAKLPDSAQRDLHGIADDLIVTHKKKGLESRSNIVLCQLLYLIKELVKFSHMPPKNGIQNAEEIIRQLAINQNEYGEWRNISETAEVTLNLLHIELDKDENNQSFLPLTEMAKCIIAAVGRLYQTYNHNTYSWYDDINTTVKAIHAICIFDYAKNFSANDFFSDISIQYRRLENQAYINQDTQALLGYIQMLYEKEQTIKNLKKRSDQKKTFQVMFFSTFVTALSLGIMMLLIIAGLSNEVVTYDGHQISVLLRLFNDWQTEFIFGFIGILCGAGFTGIYSFVKAKTFKD